MPIFNPRLCTWSATPEIPFGNVVLFGMIRPVVGSRPDLTDQQSSTEHVVNFRIPPGTKRRTVHILITQILQSKLDHLIRSGHDLVSIDIATKCIP